MKQKSPPQFFFFFFLQGRNFRLPLRAFHRKSTCIQFPGYLVIQILHQCKKILAISTILAKFHIYCVLHLQYSIALSCYITQQVVSWPEPLCLWSRPWIFHISEVPQQHQNVIICSLACFLKMTLKSVHNLLSWNQSLKFVGQTDCYVTLAGVNSHSELISVIDHLHFVLMYFTRSIILKVYIN